MDSSFKIISYNIDGLPEEIDLMDLPWYLRFIGWIYLLFKGTTKVKVNDNSNILGCISGISKWINSSGADIIGMQEDFDYHDVLMEGLDKKYFCGKHSGGLLRSGVSIFPYLRLKSDGLSLILKSDRVKIMEEKRYKWKKSYGYFSHANDKLTEKGFRFYELLLDGVIKLDLYLVHMDADFYDVEKCPDVSGDIRARKSQLNQVVENIISRYNFNYHNPILIMGDTNSSHNYKWDIDNIDNNLIKPIDDIYHLNINEAIPINGSSIDRIFYINDDRSRYYVFYTDCILGDEDVNGLSDHRPFISEFTFKSK